MKEDKNMEEAILESATELFLENGFKGTSTTEIAKHAGCNQALVHYYFRTKDRLFEAIFKNKIGMFIDSLLTAKSEDETFEDRLARKIGRHFDILAKNPKLPGLLFSELSTNPDRLESFRHALSDAPQRLIQSLNEDLKAEITKGNVREMSVYDLLLDIVSLNIIPFLLEAPFRTISQISEPEYKKLLKRRREENIKLILKGIKP